MMAEPESMEKSMSPAPRASQYIADIWDDSKNPTYIIETGQLVTINRVTAYEDTVRQLKEQVDLNIRSIEKNGYKVKALYFGKTYVLKEGQNTDQWDKSGLSSRWSTSHKEPTRQEIGGRRNMIVLTKAITEDNVPENIIEDYNKEPGKATCAAEYYTLQLEQQLIEMYKDKPLKLEQTESEGKTSKNKGYVLYMRITYRKKVDPEVRT